MKFPASVARRSDSAFLRTPGLLAGFLLGLSICTHAAPPRSGLGINLDPVAYWQTDWPFIDELKRAGGAAGGCGAPSPPCRAIAPGASFLLFQGNGGAHPAGRYVVLHDGDGKIAYSGTARRIDAESSRGRDVLEVAHRPGDSLTLRITASDERDPLRNLRVIGPGGVCDDAPLAWVPDASHCRSAKGFRSLEAASSTRIFHPAFVADLRGFRVLRFAKWTAANTSKLVHWRDRPLPADPLWSGPDGVPYEAMFELARATGADPWISLPLHVDDDFARQFGALARRALPAGATLWLEYGNEPWNEAPPYSDAGVLFERWAKERWPAATLPPWQQRLNAYALRALQVCGIVKEAFGADAARVRCAANSHAANAETARAILACELAKASLGGPCARRFDALAIAPYFGFRLGGHPQVERWAEQPEAGLAEVFREIESMRPELKRWIAASKAVADEYRLPLVAYEGGQHLLAPRGGKVEALFRAANRDPRMGAALKSLVDDWRAAGGQLFVALSYTSAAGRAGFWGMKEHQRDDTAPKWLAIEALRDAPCWWSGCTP